MTSATAKAETPAPRVFEKTGTLMAGTMLSAPAPTVVALGPFAVLAYVVAEPHYHLPADHDDPIALGTEVGLVLAVLFVGWKLAAYRLLRPSASD